jgi:acetoin utilization deacetylase AcuC-like enzyme
VYYEIYEYECTIQCAGFDAARGDPLGGYDVTPAGLSRVIAIVLLP